MGIGYIPFGTAQAASGGSGIVETVGAGSGISVDNTDPANPVVSVAPALRILGQYQFTIAFDNDAEALCNNGEGNDGRWLMAANADGAIAIDGEATRGYPFHIRGSAGSANFASISVQVLTADGASVDVGTWDWTFELFDDGVSAGLSVVVASDAVGAQNLVDEDTVAIATESNIQVFVQGAQRTGGPATAATLRAFVTVTLYS